MPVKPQLTVNEGFFLVVINPSGHTPQYYRKQATTESFQKMTMPHSLLPHHKSYSDYVSEKNREVHNEIYSKPFDAQRPL